MSTHTEVIDTVTDALRAQMAEAELTVLSEGVTLASLIREGSSVSEQALGWTQGDDRVCALSAAQAALNVRS